MKFFFLCWTLCLLSLSAYAQDFCLAKEDIIPYSPFSRFTTTCNGVTIEETALFGKDLLKKFEQKLKANKFKILLRLDNELLISKKSRKDLGVTELCLVTKSLNMGRHIVECESNPSLLLNSIKDEVVVQFAKSYNYKILQKPQVKNGFTILSR